MDTYVGGKDVISVRTAKNRSRRARKRLQRDVRASRQAAAKAMSGVCIYTQAHVERMLRREFRSAVRNATSGVVGRIATRLPKRVTNKIAPELRQHANCFWFILLEGYLRARFGR